MGEVLHAIAVFFETLAAVKFTALGLAISCHLLKTMCTSRAWRNTIAAAYPEEEVRWRSIYASYLAGVGVNAIIPARAGDAVRLYLAHRAVPASTYITLGATLLVLSVFDMAMALMIFAYALTLGVLPGIGSLGRSPRLRLRLLRLEPRVLGRAARRAGDLRDDRVLLGADPHRRVQGSASARASRVLRDRTEYLQHVASGRPATGCSASSRSGSSSTRSGSTQSIRNVLLVQVTQSLATLVPISPGGIGTEQAFIVYVFKGSVSTAQLLSFSVGMKLTLIVTNVVIGFTALFLMLGHTDWRSTPAEPAAEVPVWSAAWIRDEHPLSRMLSCAPVLWSCA